MCTISINQHFIPPGQTSLYAPDTCQVCLDLTLTRGQTENDRSSCNNGNKWSLGRAGVH